MLTGTPLFLSMPRLPGRGRAAFRPGKQTPPMQSKTEIRCCELRAEGAGRRISGTAIRYGETAQMPFGRERFLPGAFGDLSAADVVLNFQHQRDRPIARTGGGGLELVDTAESLTIRAELPSDCTDASDCLSLVRAGVLRGLSIEFHARQESMEQQTRVIERALLVRIGVVDEPAYPGAVVEARAKGKAFLRARVPFGKTLSCECHRSSSGCNNIRVEREAFDEAIEGDGEILVVGGDWLFFCAWQ